MRCVFRRLQPGVTPVKTYLKRFITNLVSYTRSASYQVAIEHAESMIADNKKQLGSKSGMYVKCFIHVSHSNNTAKTVTNGCQHVRTCRTCHRI